MAGTNKVMSLKEAISMIPDGATVALGGFLLQNKPMAATREMARQRKRGLFVICAAPSSLDIDLLAGAGCVARAVVQSISAERFGPTMPNFRKGVQDGTIEIVECDQGMVVAGLTAAKKGVPFIPTMAGLGGDFPKVNPDWFKIMQDPFFGEPTLAVRAMKPDFTLIHTLLADSEGNAQHIGWPANDRLACLAADRVIVTTEEVVPRQVVAAQPTRTVTFAYNVAAVAAVPYGAYPTACQGRYRYDEEAIRDYIAAGRGLAFERYLEKHVYGAPTQAKYMESIGIGRFLKAQTGREC